MSTSFQMKTIDAVGFIIAIVAFAFLAGVGFGGNFSDDETAKDCQQLGKFRAADLSFECRELK